MSRKYNCEHPALKDGDETCGHCLSYAYGLLDRAAEIIGESRPTSVWLEDYRVIRGPSCTCMPAGPGLDHSDDCKLERWRQDRLKKIKNSK